VASSKKKAQVGSVYAERFEIEGFIDSGVMGSVYRAKQLDRDRTVALKVINSDLIDDKEIIGRFHREMRVTAAIKHPNTVRVHQYGHTKNGELYLAMELLNGKSLDEAMLAEGPMKAERVAMIGAQIAAALGAAHAEKVVHRDLKPENIIVHQTDEIDTWIKVLDFGLAHVADSDNETDEQLTAYGARVGTPYYMAPEYVQTFELDHRSDLYALGVLMYEMLTGRPPFKGGPYEVLHKHVKEPVPPLRTANADIDCPDWLGDLIMQLLRKKPDDRPEDAAEVIRRISDEIELPELPESRRKARATKAAAKSGGGTGLLLAGVAVMVLGLGLAGLLAAIVLVALGTGL